MEIVQERQIVSAIRRPAGRPTWVSSALLMDILEDLPRDLAVDVRRRDLLGAPPGRIHLGYCLRSALARCICLTLVTKWIPMKELRTIVRKKDCRPACMSIAKCKQTVVKPLHSRSIQRLNLCATSVVCGLLPLLSYVMRTRHTQGSES